MSFQLNIKLHEINMKWLKWLKNEYFNLILIERPIKIKSCGSYETHKLIFFKMKVARVKMGVTFNTNEGPSWRSFVLWDIL
jgi:hypothetical protein